MGREGGRGGGGGERPWTSEILAKTSSLNIRPDSVAKWLCSVVVDWEVSGSMLRLNILSLT